MIAKGLDKLYFGFIFLMLSFRIQGFDILPDIVGYILFAYGLSCLSTYSYYFEKAGKFNYPAIALSIFSIYQKPAPVQGSGINMGSLGVFGLVLAAAVIILNLLIVYNIFLGIKDMADTRGNPDISVEAIEKWGFYKYLTIAGLLTFAFIFIPPLAIAFIFVLAIVSVAVLIAILGFIKKCKENLIDTSEG